MESYDRFENISPLDFRYLDSDTAEYLSEDGFTHYKLLIELALIKVLARYGICSDMVVREVDRACVKITTAEVYKEEDRIRHDIRALVNCIRAKVSDVAKPFVHMTATSYDIVDTANAARYRDATERVLVPALLKLEKVLIAITLNEAKTAQVGRTHGQHAVPITFGFAIAGYVSRLGEAVESLKALSEKLRGKFSGAVGAYNASSLFFVEPERFEREVLAELGLKPAEISTQIIPPEPLARLLCEVVVTAGILANLADDMRHLQRTEIGEVGEEFEASQVGSSTMPQKRNPINFENVKSMWKIVVSRATMIFMDQISEHQRDLTNSASARTYGEIIAYVISMTRRLTRTMQKLAVDRANLERNLAMQKDLLSAEPLYILLAAYGHPDAHERVRTLTIQARCEGRPLEKVVEDDPEIKNYLEKMTPTQRSIVSDPMLYIGIAAEKAKSVATRWKQKLDL